MATVGGHGYRGRAVQAVHTVLAILVYFDERQLARRTVPREHGHGVVVPRAVCLRLGEQGELSACFNPDTLRYEARTAVGDLYDAFDLIKGTPNKLIDLIPRDVPERTHENTLGKE